MIYNQGFEVEINSKRYFAFSYYKKEGKTVESMCHMTFPGWVHGIDERFWDCFVGTKQLTPGIPKVKSNTDHHVDSRFTISDEFISGK